MITFLPHRFGLWKLALLEWQRCDATVPGEVLHLHLIPPFVLSTCHPSTPYVIRAWWKMSTG